LLVAIVVASIFSAVILTVFISGTKSFNATGIISEIRSEADSSIGQILSEITGFDAIRVDEEKKISFYEKSLPILNSSTGLLERSTTFIPFRASNERSHSTVDPVAYTFDKTIEKGNDLVFEKKIEHINDQINIQKPFTISNPEYVEVTNGIHSGKYVVHGILTITLKLRSSNEDERQTLTSTIGF